MQCNFINYCSHAVHYLPRVLHRSFLLSVTSELPPPPFHAHTLCVQTYFLSIYISELKNSTFKEDYFT